MRRDTGGVEYDADARLLFGNAAGRAHLAADAASLRRWNCTCAAGREANDGENSDVLESASDAEKEARLVRRRLLELKNQRALICDRSGRQQ